MTQRRSYPTWQHRHEAVLRWCLLNPDKRLKDCASDTGYSVSHISRIVNSPDFRREYESARNLVRLELGMNRMKQRER